MFSKWWGLASRAASMVATSLPLPTFSPRVFQLLTWEARLGLCERPAPPAIWALHARATLISWPSVASGGTPCWARTALMEAKTDLTVLGGKVVYERAKP